MNSKAFHDFLKAAALLALTVGSQFDANADTIWNLADVQLSDGTFLNGSFTVNQYGYLSSWNLTTSSGSGFTTYTYIPSINSSINYPDDTVVTFYHDNPDYYGSLQLTFQNGLSAAAASDPIIGGVGSPSLECGGWTCSASTPIRYILGKQSATMSTVSAVPLPSAAWLVGSGLAGVLGFGRRHRIKN